MRFHKTDLIEDIKKDSWKNGSLQNFTPNLEKIGSSQSQKEKVLKAIIETKDPMTFVFNGHWSDNAIYLSDWWTTLMNSTWIIETDSTVKIDVDELFQAYKSRGNHNETSIFLLSACFSNNFIRKFYKKCQESDIRMPIMVSQSEYWQLWYTEEWTKYDNHFLKTLVSPDSWKNATLWNIIEDDFIMKHSNPSVFIPDNQNNQIQISEKQKDSSFV